MQKRFNISGTGGFTLVELLVVMVIIGLLATLVAPRLIRQLGKSQQSAAKSQVASLEQGLDKFRLDTGRYPSTQEGLSALVTNPGIEKWDGPYVKGSLLSDPWGRPYHYECPGTHGDFDIYSYGRDGNPGGDKEDKDINNWEQ